ncbi:Ldh family oxidoreductase [Planococcus halotolerans]|uniref:Ldh family oxidoreductase n=1 Tax=Planococcus halotolerans TaxID=2233542 RepID=UPI001091A25F|nr:Ldh family oxidoreductase [Planococcus halotolerans]QHJ70121.1 hypothetical protein DNR44_005685 [Planococcus halotolerans]
MNQSKVTISLYELENFYNAIFTKLGVPEEIAAISAKNFIYADSKGADTHGVLRLPLYVQRLQKGLVEKNPNLKWELETDNSAVLDAGNGLGFYTTQMAVEKAVEKAKGNGISMVTIYNNNHFGAAGCYAKMIAEENMIGFVTTNGAPLIAPVGGAERILGNNPFSFAVPRKNHEPVVFDMANSIVSAGKLMVAHHQGESIPEGWALDENGEPTTDPYRAYNGGGSLVPIAEHKGFGLSLMMDILSGVLSGANFGKNVSGLANYEKITGNGNAIIAINIEKLMPEERFFERLESLLHMVVGAKKAPGTERIYLPGERGQQVQEKNRQTGISINSKLHEELQEIASSLEAPLYKFS